MKNRKQIDECVCVLKSKTDGIERRERSSRNDNGDGDGDGDDKAKGKGNSSKRYRWCLWTTMEYKSHKNNNNQVEL